MQYGIFLHLENIDIIKIPTYKCLYNLIRLLSSHRYAVNLLDLVPDMDQPRPVSRAPV